jgi:hypothetical protein
VLSFNRNLPTSVDEPLALSAIPRGVRRRRSEVNDQIIICVASWRSVTTRSEAL